MLEAIHDTVKSRSHLRKTVGKICNVPGCNNPLTIFNGPGSDTLCREHQLNLVEYGGLGKPARPHTFHRDWVCIECNTNVLEDPRLADVADEAIKRRIARSLMHGDHNIKRKADGGDDTAENVKSLCFVCHAKKSTLEEDWQKPNKVDIQDTDSYIE
jgi:hypothetical protein